MENIITVNLTNVSGDDTLYIVEHLHRWIRTVVENPKDIGINVVLSQTGTLDELLGNTTSRGV